MASWFAAQADEFAGPAWTTAQVVGALCTRSGFATVQQKDTWIVTVDLLKRLLASIPKAFLPCIGVCLEFILPGIERRLDAVLVCRHKLLLIEFKVHQDGVGEVDIAPAVRQVHYYRLDLQDFHETSGDLEIHPVLAILGGDSRSAFREVDVAKTSSPVSLCTSEDDLERLVQEFAADADGDTAWFQQWMNGRYRPVPGIVESAQLSYRGMTVRDIAKYKAENVEEVLACIREIAAHTAAHGLKTICFLTGIPGGGKTFVGLSVVHDPDIRKVGYSSFLSGNVPLVEVLTEALVHDYAAKQARAGMDLSMAKARREFPLIRDVHKEISQALRGKQDPLMQIAVFDEAQRAYDAASTQGVQRRKRTDDGQARELTPTFHSTKAIPSEPEILLEYLGRRKDWVLLIALIGDGQEINKGEVGIAGWGEALSKPEFSDWSVFVAPDFLPKLGLQRPPHASAAGSVQLVDHLDLKASERSFGFPQLPEWVGHVIEGRASEASRLLAGVAGTADSPILLTRDLACMRTHLHDYAVRSGRRVGLVASSSSGRLRAYGIEVGLKGEFPTASWYLSPETDVRSSFALELVATEYQCQGLELDAVGLCWGGDLVRHATANTWLYRKLLSGEITKWTKGDKQLSPAEIDWAQRLKNKYRVLLTRSREQLVIWIPPGDLTLRDKTLHPACFDATAEFLRQCGVGEI